MNHVVWQGEKDVQVVPEGEEHVHLFDITCGCKPNYTLDQNNQVTVTMHKSFIGETHGIGILHTVMQKKDC